MPSRRVLAGYVRFAAFVAILVFVLEGTGQGYLRVWPMALAFGFAMFALDLFDLWLPHGDTIGVDGALVAAAIVTIGPFAACLAAGIARVVAHAMQQSRGRSTGLITALEKRAVGIIAGSCTVLLLEGSLASPMGELLASLAVCATVLMTELFYAQLLSSRLWARSFAGLVQGNIRMQWPVLAAQVSVSGLVVVTFAYMQVWSILVATVLLLLIRQSYALLLDVRAAYRCTVEVLIDAAEGSDPGRAGHAERVAGIARRLGRALGLATHEMERLSYAALLHDVDLIGADAGDPIPELRASVRVLQDVEFLREIVPVLQACDGAASAPGSAAAQDALLAFIVCLASDIDARENGVFASDVKRIAQGIPSAIKGRVTGVAVSLGYRVPAVD